MRTGNLRYLGEKQNISFSQKGPNMGCESCTVLRLRSVHKLAMSHIWSNIPLRLKEFPRAKPEGTLEGKGIYLTVYLKSSPNTDSISFNSHKANNTLISFVDN